MFTVMFLQLIYSYDPVMQVQKSGHLKTMEKHKYFIVLDKMDQLCFQLKDLFSHTFRNVPG